MNTKLSSLRFTLSDKNYRLDPIWTVKTGSLFTLTIESERLFMEEGMKFLVKDFDQVGANETLGLVHVPPKSLYTAKGERMEFKLQPVPGKTAEEVPGHLAIRCRRATDYDIEFMASYESSQKAMAAPVLPKTSNSTIKSIISKTVKVEHDIKKVRSICNLEVPQFLCVSVLLN